MLAFGGLTVCGAHGGFSIWARQGKLKRSGKKAAFKAQRAAMTEDRVEVAPTALVRLQVYQEADERTRMRLARAFGNVTWAKIVKEIRGIEGCA
jgi:hypothetical protein